MDVVTVSHLLNAYEESCVTYYAAPSKTTAAVASLKAMHVYRDFIKEALYAYQPPPPPPQCAGGALP